MKKAMVLGKYLCAVIMIGLLVSLAACTSSSSSIPTQTTPPPAGISKSITIDISAENIAFNKGTITVPAGADVTIVFNNKDRVPHNVAVYETQVATRSIFVGEVFTGLKTVNYRFTAPSTPGTYFFRCDVHPGSMTGDFIVTNAGS